MCACKYRATVAEQIFTEPMLAGQIFVQNFCAKFLILGYK